MPQDTEILKERFQLAVSDMNYACMIEIELRKASGSLLLEDALRMSWIITYARPFTVSKASNRQKQLWLKPFNDEIATYLQEINPRLYEVHNSIIGERHQLVSHSDTLHHKTNGSFISHSLCFQSYSHKEFNEVNLLMDSFLSQKLKELS